MTTCHKICRISLVQALLGLKKFKMKLELVCLPPFLTKYTDDYLATLHQMADKIFPVIAIRVELIIAPEIVKTGDNNIVVSITKCEGSYYMYH